MLLTIDNTNSDTGLYLNHIDPSNAIAPGETKTITMNIFDTKLLLSKDGCLEITNEYNIMSCKSASEKLVGLLSKNEDGNYLLRVLG